MFFFCKQDMVGNALKNLHHKKKVKRLNVLTGVVVSVTSLSEILILTCCEASGQEKKLEICSLAKYFLSHTFKY